MCGPKQSETSPPAGTGSRITSAKYQIGKGNHISGQKGKVLKAFTKPATMLMASGISNVEVETICSYFRYFRKHNLVTKVRIDDCKISKKRAVYYQANNVSISHKAKALTYCLLRAKGYSHSIAKWALSERIII